MSAERKLVQNRDDDKSESHGKVTVAGQDEPGSRVAPRTPFERGLLLLPLMLILALVVSLSVGGAPPPSIQSIEQSIRSPARPAGDRARDRDRNPAAVLALLAPKRGETVLDVFANPGYYTELIAPLVGSAGTVIAYDPPQFIAAPAARANWRDRTARHRNVRQLLQPYDDLRIEPKSVDAVLMHLAYHEAYWESPRYGLKHMEPRDLVRRIWTALKPGGRLLIVDHVAEPGDPRETVEKYHRIPVTDVVRDVTSAGFVLRTTSEILRNAGDDRRLSVFDARVRGHTDRMVLMFVKP